MNIKERQIKILEQNLERNYQESLRLEGMAPAVLAFRKDLSEDQKLALIKEKYGVRS